MHRLLYLSYMFCMCVCVCLSLRPPPTLNTAPFSGRTEPNKCSSTIIGGLEQPIWFNEVIHCSLSPLLTCLPVCLLANYTVPCLAFCPIFFFSHSFSPPFFLRPCWALIKPGTWERRGTFESEMARGMAATYLQVAFLLTLWKPSLQGGGFPLLHVCYAQRCSTCRSGVTSGLCSSVCR